MSEKSIARNKKAFHPAVCIFGSNNQYIATKTATKGEIAVLDERIPSRQLDSWEGHANRFIRAICPSADSPDQFFSGADDGTIKQWKFSPASHC